jgi:hypothetical protein
MLNSKTNGKRRAILLIPFVFLVPCLGLGLCFAQPAHPLNAPSQQDKPYVLLISLDGFR